MSTRLPHGRIRPRRLLFPLLLAAVLGLYATAYAAADERLPQGSRIEGIDVGGLTPEEARQSLHRVVRGRAGNPVVVRAGGRTLQVVPRAVGLTVDVGASVDQVPVGASWNPVHLWKVFKGPRSFDAVVEAGPELGRALERFAARLERPAVHGGIEFKDGRAEPSYPRSGTRLDVVAARAAVSDAFAAGRSTVQLSLDELAPRLSEAQVDQAMTEFAVPAMSAPVTFLLSARRVTLSPAEYDNHLGMRRRGDKLVPYVRGTWLAKSLEKAVRDADQAPRDATVRLVRGQPTVVPGRAGRLVAQRRAAVRFLGLLAADQSGRSAPLPTVERQPEVSADVARSWRIRRVVSSFTTYYPHADYRNTNIGRASQLVDGTVLRPGALFSLNETVGERTAENGFARGFIISDGVFKEDFGGGVSQVATTVFNAAFFAGLEDVEHKPHSFFIDRYPVGREATVAWPTVDLRFRNDTKFGVLVETVHTPSTPTSSGALTVRLWSSKVWDIESRTSERYAFTQPEVRVLSGDTCVPNEGYGGFQVDVTRVFRRVGERTIRRTERMHTTYTPSDTVVCQ